MNTVAPASALPPGDCLLAQNLISGEYGLRARLGWREWCTGIDSGAAIRSILVFTGNANAGTADKVFATTTDGIYDVTASANNPSQVVAFGTADANSGYGVSRVLVTSAGHFLLYTDESNGYYLYSGPQQAWVKIAASGASAWQANHAYTAGAYVSNGGNTYLCTTSGTSAMSGGPTGTTIGADIADNTAHWTYAPVVSGVDPSTLVSVTVWKSYAWFVQRDTGLGWFLPVASFAGSASSINVGANFKAGGPLRGLWNWTLEAGTTMDQRLFGISSGGDIVVYSGTDPTSSSTFGLIGTWSVGAVPSGRTFVTEFGGDALIVSMNGLIPLSQIVQGKLATDVSQFKTTKISNLINYAVSAYGGSLGWQVRQHPEDNCILVLVPSNGAGVAGSQYAMSLSEMGWGTYQDAPIVCGEQYGGKFYFGTADGRVCIHDGYVDGVLLSDANAYSPVRWMVQTAFNSLGNGNKKQVQTIRVLTSSMGSASGSAAAARYDYDQSSLASSGTGVAGGNTWDNAKWDSALWGGAYSASQALNGATGVGTNVSIIAAGSSVARTIVSGFDVAYTQGGFI